MVQDILGYGSPRRTGGKGGTTTQVLEEPALRGLTPTEEALRAAQQSLAALLDALPAQAAILDQAGTIIEVNQAWRRFAEANGYSGVAWFVGANYLSVCERAQGVGAAEAQAVATGLRRVLAGHDTVWSMDYACPGPSEQRWFQVQATRLAGLGPGRALVAHTDITTRKQAEDAAQERDLVCRDLFTGSSDLIQTISPDGWLLSVNPAWRTTLGYSPQETGHLTIFDVLHPDHRGPCRTLLQRLAAGERGERFDPIFLSREGKKVRAEGGFTFRFAGGQPVSGLGIFRDVTARRQAEEALRELTNVDGLTGLYNRREMSRRLREEVDRYRRYERPLSLVLIGQDPLPLANAHHRQHLSDYVLCWMARLLSEDVRTMDLLARYGHDELAIILPETPAEGAYVVGERIRRRIAAHPCLVEQDGRAPVAVPITVSVGVATASVGVRSEAGLVSAAVLALNEARQLRNTTSLFGVRRQ